MNKINWMIKSLAILSFIFCLFSFSFTPVAVGDIWWHLKAGEWIWQNGRVPLMDPFTFSGEQIRWVCVHWLGSLLLYGTHAVGGILGLKIFKLTVFLCTFGIFLFYARRKIPLSWLMFLSLLLVYGLAGRLLARPDVLNLIFIQIFLIHLFHYENTSKRNILFMLPLWGILWRNIHLGGAIYGTLLIAVFVLGSLFRMKDVNSRKQVKELSVVFFLYILSSLVSPYGLEGFLYPFKVFLRPDYIGFYQSTRFSLEALSSWKIFTSAQYIYCHIILILSIIVTFLNRKNPWTMILLLFSAFVMFLGMIRNIPFYFLVCAYVIVEGSWRIGLQERWLKWAGSRNLARGLFISICMVFIWHIADFSSQRSLYGSRQVSYLADDGNYFTDTTIRLLLDNNITGPAFNSDMIGNEILWKAYPKIRPFWDCRYLDYQKHAFSLAILNYPEQYWMLMTEKFGFKIAMLDSSYPLYARLIKHLAHDSLWQLISVNGPIIVFVKKGEFNLNPELGNFEQSLKSARISPIENEHLNGLLLRAPGSPYHLIPSFHFVNIQSYLEGAALSIAGYRNAPAKLFINTLEVSNDPRIRNSIIAHLSSNQ